MLVRTKGQYVSRGGDKLAGALKELKVDPCEWICADIGASTGGFTDCLLQHGAARVYSVDVGYGLLDWKLRSDERVTVLERTNGRYITAQQIPELLDFAVLDASFISLQLLLTPLLPLFGKQVRIMALVKPQFELPREQVGPGGVVREKELHQQAVAMVEQFATDSGLNCRGCVASQLRGAKGNQEFLLYLERLAGSVKTAG